jgi:dipeptidyl-peptidase-4
MDLGMEEDSYLARVFWWPDGSLGAIALSRDQATVNLLRLDPRTGARQVALHETCPCGITLPRDPVAPLAAGGFVWASERSGFRHLYLYDAAGALVRPLTTGEWMVDNIAGLDEAGQQVCFTGNREDPTETQLYAVPLAGGEVRRVTPEPGTHQVALDTARRRFVDVRSALDQPQRDPRIATYGLEQPEIITLRNRTGTLLYGAVYRPPARCGPGPYPTIVAVYGGPIAQQVTNSWGLTAALQTQYLREQGFLVFRLDNRGSARRGQAFEGALHLRMGTVEVEDQVDGVRWLVAQGLADPERVGVTGWSYGGYMTLQCLAQAPEVFKVGVAGAPVTAWDAYDTAYTERYMGTPASNPAGYEEASVLRQVGNIRGRLLIIHGMLDENVHFRHTARLLDALHAARKEYELVALPSARHMLRHPADRLYREERTVEFFRQYL